MALLAGFRALQGVSPVETVAKTPTEQPPEPIVMPAPPARPRPVAADAMARLDGRRSGACEIRIIGHGNAPKGAVVAILNGESGAHLATKQLDGGKLPIKLTFADIPDGDHWAVLALNVSELRFAYLGRTRLKPHTRMPGRRAAILRGQVYELSVQLKKDNTDAICHNVPVLLRRQEDPEWRYRVREHEPHEVKDLGDQWLLLTDQNGRIVLREVGAGRYVLHADGFERAGNAQEWQPVKVDQDRQVTITGAAR